MAAKPHIRALPGVISSRSQTTADVSLGIELVTPERAYELLVNNTNNRSLRPRDVARYARDMIEGNWKPGAGEPIHVAPDGQIGNGQHRLYAVIEADTPIELPFLYAPIDYRQVADQGIKRTFGDVLRIEYGESNAAALGAAIRLLHEYRKQGTLGMKNYAPSVSELVDVYLAEPEIKLSVKAGNRTNENTGVRPALAIVMHYLFSQVSREDADRFFNRLIDGASLAPGDPILAARKWFFGPSRTQSVRDQAAVLIKAFNAMRSGSRQTYFKNLQDVPPIQGLTR